MSQSDRTKTRIQSRPLTDFTPQQYEQLSATTVVSTHQLTETGLFSDEGLARLLDRHPRDRLQAFTMGEDPERREEWQPVDLGDADGAGILTVVRKGRVWVNARDVHEHHREVREIYDQLSSELGDARPDLRPGAMVLMIGSPRALVYYHADANSNMLFHLRGAKTVWVYPAADPAFASRAQMEDIYADVTDEELPYSRAFDEHAEVIELEPGRLANWPHNAPHRTENHGTDIDAALSYEYWTMAGLRRQQVVLANRFLRRRLHIPCSSWRETGWIASAKRVAYRAAGRFGVARIAARDPHIATLQFDPDAPNGLRSLDPTPTSYTAYRVD